MSSPDSTTEPAPFIEIDGVEHMNASSSTSHGFLNANKDWAPPEVVAKSFSANRGDQGNFTAAHEYLDSPEVLYKKMSQVASMLKKAKKACVYAGAGLSRSSGIPDYASKGGVSCVKPKKDLGLLGVYAAEPTYAHWVLATMHKQGYLQGGLVQQNHDGLPQKAGFPQEAINEIHGAWFDPSNPVIQFSGSLRNDLFQRMEDLEQEVDMTLVLGTSLSGMNADRMAYTPAKKAKKQNKGLGSVIINIQKTPMDDKELCSVRVWAKLDDAFKILAELLHLNLQPLNPPDYSKYNNVFKVPYNEQGKLDFTKSMTLDLNKGAQVVVCDPFASNLGNEGFVSDIDDDGTFVLKMKTKYGHSPARLGWWWVDVLVRGNSEFLPVMNQKAQVDDAHKVPCTVPWKSQ